ncbi:Uncharacterized protein K02A2.6 [Exaiptasia diaphana]|nr:Uncharacterized protein K02A2.6 [Exaiptasia diaphana]
MYLYGAHFTLVTDHKPLLSILGPKTGLLTLAATRLQRWSLVLSEYDYGIEYRKSESHANADALSRLPDKTAEIEEARESSIHTLSYSDQLSITSLEIRRARREKPVLAKAYDYTLNGWPEHNPDESLTPYFRRRHELTTEDGCLLWDSWVVIPPTYRHRLLTELHEEHHGISTRRLPAEAPLVSWDRPTRPWQRVHVDFAEKGGVMFLILIDAHSKWIEVTPMSSTTAERTIDVLRSCFGRYGLPEQLVSDNGPQFTSREFKLFMERNGIKHKLMPPYHPSSNGAAGRSVQIVKTGLEKQSKFNNDRWFIHVRLKNCNSLLTSSRHTKTSCRSSGDRKMSKTCHSICMVARTKQEHQRVDRKLQSVLPSKKVKPRTTESHSHATTTLAKACSRSHGDQEITIFSSNCLLLAIIELAKLENSTASKEVINQLKSIMGRHGIPETMLTDNGPQFSSKEFTLFSNEYGFSHVTDVTSSPLHSSGNVEVERAVRTVKDLIDGAKDSYIALLNYRNTPLNNGYIPAQSLLSRNLRTKIAVVPTQLQASTLDQDMLQEKEERRKINMKLNFDTHHSAKPFSVLQQGDQVWIKDRKESATVKDKVHERSYLIETQNSTFRRNRVQLNKLPKKEPNSTQSTPTAANKERTKPELPTAQQKA